MHVLYNAVCMMMLIIIIVVGYTGMMGGSEKQYWDIKSKDYDTVIFFKIGKFYELFDIDAAIGVKELDLSYMTSDKRPHAGIPEQSLDEVEIYAYTYTHHLSHHLITPMHCV